MRKVALFSIFFLSIFITVSAQDEEKKKKKGFFAKIAEAFKPIPGELNAGNIDKYYQAFSVPNSTDPELFALNNDTAMHVVFPARLGAYDEKNQGFPIIINRYEYPSLRSDAGIYYFFLNNLNHFRFFKITKEEVKEKFDIVPFDFKFSVERELQGKRNLALKLYFKADTAFENSNKARIVPGSIHKMTVILLRNGDDDKGEVATIEEPHVFGKTIPSYYANLEDTQLHKYFKKYPFYTDEDWPRVAITFVQFPEIYKKMIMQNPVDKSIGTSNGAGGIINMEDFGSCYLKASIWTSETEKIDIPVFSWHPYDFNTYGTPTDNISSWGLGSVAASLKENTGYKRTEGPIPPRYPFPQTPSHHKAYSDYSTGGALVIADILNKIGYEWNKIEDRRIWFIINE